MEVDIYENPFLERDNIVKAESGGKPCLIVRDYYSFMMMGGTGKVKFEDRLGDCFEMAKGRVYSDIDQMVKEKFSEPIPRGEGFYKYFPFESSALI